MKSKGQAALEFLTTYGWAFLVILIMISTLAYFGVLKPSRLLPDRCSTGPEFECQDFQISHTDNVIKIRLKNNMGDPVSVTSINVSSESAVALTCTGPGAIGTWGTSDVKDITFTNCNSDAVGFIKDEKGKVFFSMRYNSVRSGSGYSHDLNGEILSTVV